LSLLALFAFGKGSATEANGNQPLQCLGFWIGFTRFPILHATPMYANFFGKLTLRQRNASAEREQSFAKFVFMRPIGSMRSHSLALRFYAYRFKPVSACFYSMFLQQCLGAVAASSLLAFRNRTYHTTVLPLCLLILPSWPSILIKRKTVQASPLPRKERARTA
jgi:hypothetical protein